MRKLLILLLIVFAFTLIGAKNIKLPKGYTIAIPIASDTHYSQTDDTVFHMMPIPYDTTFDTNFYGEVDTMIEVHYPFPSVYDQNSYEEMQDTGTAYMTFDRWAMEDWAIAAHVTDMNVAEDYDSVDLHLQYQFEGAPAWTVPYQLVSSQGASSYLLTFYPLDLYDNWKLYYYSRLRVIFVSDSVSVRTWLVGRKIKYHRHVDPGE